MPVQVSYPGVYLEEIPSGNFTVTGVPTAVTAFVGRTVMGPANEPTPCFSYADFETLFGGRAHDYPLSYAVEDFFQNGGGEALIVRVTSSGTAAAPASVALSGINFAAASAGAWGNNLTLTVDTAGLTQTVADRFGLQLADLFNLNLTYTKPNKQVVMERFTALTVLNKANRVDRVLQQQSSLARASWPAASVPTAAPAASAVADGKTTPTLFASGTDGGPLADTDIIGTQGARTGIYALEKADLFNLLCIPWDVRGTDIPAEVNTAAGVYCAQRRAMYIVDGPEDWTNKAHQGQIAEIDPTTLGITDQASQRNSAVYFPKVRKPDPEMGGAIDVFPPCGIIAGQMANTDLTRGVWKAPAGIATGLAGVTALDVNLTDGQHGLLNPIGINCLRNFRVLGPLVWGSRTLRGADLMSDDFKYVPVRRLTLYIEESLFRGTKFAVFEPNDETLWSQLRLTVGAFMADLSRQGAFYGYSVTCDKTTTTPYDIDRGIVNIRVAFAPVKPAEFVVLQIQQQAASAAS